MSESNDVSLSATTVEKLRERSQASGFDSVSEYAEYVLKTVLNELEPIEPVDNEESERELRSRLKSLGYLED